MSKANEDTTKNQDNKDIAEEEAEKEAPKNKEKEKKAARRQNPQLPLLIDAAITAAQIIVLLVGVITTLLALIEGVQVWVAALRGAAAVFMVGLMFWFANWLLGRRALEAAYEHLKEQSEEKKVESTIERRA